MHSSTLLIIATTLLGLSQAAPTPSNLQARATVPIDDCYGKAKNITPGKITQVFGTVVNTPDQECIGLCLAYKKEPGLWNQLMYDMKCL
ncbi:hypothetical protein TWF281_004146 [Arthrobotrys megalospora]